MNKVERTATRINGLRNPELDFQLMRQLGVTVYGGGSPGEVFYALQHIDAENPTEWPAAFEDLARRVDASGEAAAERGHTVSAREAFLRASMYFRAAEYFSDPFSADMWMNGLASRHSFMRATEYMRESVRPLEIPYQGTTLPGYFMQPAEHDAVATTILILTGFDGTAEELYFQAAYSALQRGFNVAIAEGPGQVGAMREHPDLIFRHDYEVPVRAIIDHVLEIPGVDGDRFGLYGISFGGYFALRAAEHDERIKALILNSPIVDLRRYMLGFIDDTSVEQMNFTLDDLNDIPEHEMSKVQKLSFKGACRRFGVRTFRDWFKKLEDYTAIDNLSKIKCPSLALVGAGEGAEAMTQFETFCARASGRVTRRVFDQTEGADMHCQVGNLSLANGFVFDWLKETIG
jgi:pimeloyl-ACP methyl ester carboxylesterase